MDGRVSCPVKRAYDRGGLAQREDFMSVHYVIFQSCLPLSLATHRISWLIHSWMTLVLLTGTTNNKQAIGFQFLTVPKPLGVFRTRFVRRTGHSRRTRRHLSLQAQTVRSLPSKSASQRLFLILSVTRHLGQMTFASPPAPTFSSHNFAYDGSYSGDGSPPPYTEYAHDINQISPQQIPFDAEYWGNRRGEIGHLLRAQPHPLVLRCPLKYFHLTS
jgi:hypothetical protein